MTPFSLVRGMWLLLGCSKSTATIFRVQYSPAGKWVYYVFQSPGPSILLYMLPASQLGSLIT